MKAIIAQKKEMTQVFDEDGKVVPVTIVDVNEVYMIGKKDEEKDGYQAIILGKGKKKNANKPEVGKYKKLGFVPNFIKEIRDTDVELEENTKIDATMFENGEVISVTGDTKGKGFQGVVKRWNFHGGPKTHGQSDRWRAPGSIGSGTTPGRVYKGKKMAGRMGGNQITVNNLEIVLVDKENGLIGIKGSIPGNKGSYIIIKSKE
jgi:large subunit ribosomal protein L3